jgi:hypothetical protein
VHLKATLTRKKSTTPNKAAFTTKHVQLLACPPAYSCRISPPTSMTSFAMWKYFSRSIEALTFATDKFQPTNAYQNMGQSFKRKGSRSTDHGANRSCPCRWWQNTASAAAAAAAAAGAAYFLKSQS